MRVEGPLPGSVVPSVALSDGRELAASLVWIGVEVGAGSLSGWLPSVERWVVTPASEGAIPASVGSWHVVADLPPDAGGQALRLNDRTIRVNWLAEPEALRPGSAPAGEAWEPWRRPAGTPMPTSSLLAPEWRSPLRRWRARLVTTGLDAPAPIEALWLVEGERAVLDALADLVEARWRVGLARLWYADAVACGRLVARLTRTVGLAPGIDAPAWPADQKALDSLLTDLLDPALGGARLAARSEAWLGSLPDAAAWIVDDAAGWGAEGGGPVARLGVAVLTDRPGLLWVEGAGGVRVGDPLPIRPGVVAALDVEAAEGSPEVGARRFGVHAGDAVVEVGVREVESIRPPGARCGPLLHDWTLDAWGASDPSRGATPDAAAAAMLYRDGSGASDSGWSLFLECAGGGGGADDVVRVWFGPRGAATGLLRVSGDGVVRDERGSGEEVLLGVSEEPGRWSMTVAVPREAVGPDGVILLGISRVDARGARTAWPRRLMPWEEEPARAAIDTRTWGGLREAGG